MELEDLKKPFLELSKIFGTDYDNWQERIISVPISRTQANEINKMFHDLIAENNSSVINTVDKLSDFTEMTIPMLGKLKFKIKD